MLLNLLIIWSLVMLMFGIGWARWQSRMEQYDKGSECEAT